MTVALLLVVLVLAAVVAALLLRRRPALAQALPAPKELLKQLPPELAGRCLELAGIRDQVRKTVKEHGMELVLGDQLRQLETLVETYQRLAIETARYRAYLQSAPPGAIEKEIERTRKRLEAAEMPDVKATIAQNCAVLEKRLEKLQQIRDVAGSLKLKLDAIEDTVHLIHDQAMTASAPEDIQVDYQRIMADVASADAALAETRAYLGGHRAPVSH